jgi:creatinine amidohydrolase
MRIEELNWMDVEEYLKADDRLMLVTGSTEQHGYLSLLTDIRIPLALADAASKTTGVLVAPALNYGVSPYFLAYPGTFSLRASTLMAAVEDIVRSAFGQGFRRMLVLNGHGGNSPGRARLRELCNELPGLEVDWYDWWSSHSVESVAAKHDLRPAHANWLEAFPFTTVTDLPEQSKTPPNVPRGIMDSGTTRRIYEDGSFGGPYHVDDVVMQEVFAAALADVLQCLTFE